MRHARQRHQHSNNSWHSPVPSLRPTEQRRIVEAIESYFTRLDDAVATLERVQRNLKRYRASVLKAAVEGRLVPTEAELARAEGRDYEPASALLERILAERRRRWHEAGGRGKYQEPVAPDTTDLPELPEGWCWASVDGCRRCSLATAGSPVPDRSVVSPVPARSERQVTDAIDSADAKTAWTSTKRTSRRTGSNPGISWSAKGKARNSWGERHLPWWPEGVAFRRRYIRFRRRAEAVGPEFAQTRVSLTRSSGDVQAASQGLRPTWRTSHR